MSKVLKRYDATLENSATGDFMRYADYEELRLAADGLRDALNRVLAIGAGDFNGVAMECYCGTVEGPDGDLDEEATCAVCEARAALAAAAEIEKQ